MTEPLSWGLTEAAAAIRDRRISSVELTAAALDRAEAMQPSLNAFITFGHEGALASARSADDAVRRGDTLGPLHGVPMAHKDMVYRAGEVTSCGSRIRAGFVPDVTATVLQRLDAAGAVITGTLNMSEFAVGPTGHNAHFGRARNPWDPSRITGGSSSGSGAAVAARAVFGSLGSDTTGSVRLPAAMCGVVGLKPTHGRVSRYGMMGLSHSLDTAGPLARSSRDCALLLELIAGADPQDPTCSIRTVSKADLGGRLDGIRIGIPAYDLPSAVDPRVAAALEASRIALEQLGATAMEVQLPDIDRLGDLATVVMLSEAAALHQDWLRQRPDHYGASVRARLLTGLAFPAVLYLRALQLRSVILRQMLDGALARVDALHLPAISMPVPIAAEVEDGEGGLPAETISAIIRWTRPVSYLGLPALVTPIGFDGNGMPMAMQLVGRPFAEATLLRIGDAYERATDWLARVPPPP